MWDVKTTIKANANIGMNSFTLTMWDVKFVNILAALGQMIGFTLTMWDVKQLEQMQEYAQIEFYLNYVGCKDQKKVY